MTLKYCGQRREIYDTVFRLLNQTDPTKILALNCAGVSASTTRTLTIPDASGTIALTSGITPNIDGLTEKADPALLSDYAVIYDVDGAAHKKVRLDRLWPRSVAWRVGPCEFAEGVTTSGFNSLSGIAASGSVAVAAAEQYHNGIVTLSTGTSASGRYTLYTHTASIALNSGKVRVCTILKTEANLSGSGQTYAIRAGLMNSTGAGDGSHGVYFRYTDTQNSGKWQGICRAASTETVLDTGVTVAASTWYRLDLEVSADNGTVEFFINGVSKGTVTTNIPNHNQQVGCHVSLQKTAGTTARTMQVDFFDALGEFNSAR